MSSYGTGTSSLSETVALTARADDLGYRVALVLPPYYKPAGEDGLAVWYAGLHDALGSRGIAIHFYNFPQMTGIDIPVGLIARLAAHAPARFTGIKDSSGDLDYCRVVVAAAPGLRVFPSAETALGTAEVDGFAGCISASVNVTEGIAGRIWAARADPPSDLVAEVARQRRLLAGPDLIAGVKRLVAIRTANADWRRVLPPLLPLGEAEGRRLDEALAPG